MTLLGRIRNTDTREVREASSDLLDYEAAKAAIVAQVSEGEQLLSLRHVTAYRDER